MLTFNAVMPMKSVYHALLPRTRVSHSYHGNFSAYSHNFGNSKWESVWHHDHRLRVSAALL